LKKLESKNTKGEIYDRFAPHYERVIGPIEKRFLSRLRSEIVKAIPAVGFMLEIGAGTGLNFAHYPATIRGVASEPSLQMIRIAGAKDRPVGIKLLRCSAEALPFSDGSFDGALATLVMCSVRSPQAAFAELRRVIKPGGTIALLEHVRPRNLLGPVFDLLNLMTVPLFDDHFNRRTAAMAEQAGLQVVNIESHALGIVQVIICRTPPP
jgi:ubiquinone/menaquinone biosynthesis C-methylase UbiE